ncbi:hypothetical protein D0Y65_043239 [Glycine soja]|uniref:Retrotransposon gag domain-containing protein n=1 Tax=Glycine soja TaxID=3848 RepID=A0A445GGN2_GLYSO|nr:hypothetical protein D0Y65_043239 [Glycine soja]
MEDLNTIGADCVVISCCCQCLMLQILVFVLLKLPGKLIRKTREYAKKLRHRKANNDRRMGREMGSYKDVLLRIHEQSFRIQVEMALTDGADHNCGGCMDEVEKVMEEFYQKGEFAFGSFWGRKGPYSTKPSGSSDKLHDAFIRLTNQQLSLGESMNFMTHKIDELFHRVSPLLTTSPPIPSSLSHSSPAPALNHRMKLDVPRFDGTDPLGWIFKINQFFEYHSTREHDCLTISSFYMEGCALAWFQWMTGNSQFTSWSFSSRPCKLDSHRGSTRILSGPYSS